MLRELALAATLLALATGCGRTVDGVCILADSCRYMNTERVCREVFPATIRFESLGADSLAQSHTENKEAARKLCQAEGFPQCNDASGTCTRK